MLQIQAFSGMIKEEFVAFWILSLTFKYLVQVLVIFFAIQMFFLVNIILAYSWVYDLY